MLLYLLMLFAEPLFIRTFTTIRYPIDVVAFSDRPRQRPDEPWH